jgi:hypothetical protein
MSVLKYSDLTHFHQTNLIELSCNNAALRNKKDETTKFQKTKKLKKLFCCFSYVTDVYNLIESAQLKNISLKQKFSAMTRVFVNRHKKWRRHIPFGWRDSLRQKDFGSMNVESFERGSEHRISLTKKGFAFWSLRQKDPFSRSLFQKSVLLALSKFTLIWGWVATGTFDLLTLGKNHFEKVIKIMTMWNLENWSKRRQEWK